MVSSLESNPFKTGQSPSSAAAIGKPNAYSQPIDPTLLVILQQQMQEAQADAGGQVPDEVNRGGYTGFSDGYYSPVPAGWNAGSALLQTIGQMTGAQTSGGGMNIANPAYLTPLIGEQAANQLSLQTQLWQKQQSLSALKNNRYSNDTGTAQRIRQLESEISAIEQQLGVGGNARQVQYDTTPAYQQAYIPDNVRATALAAQNAGVPLSKIQWENVAPGSVTRTSDYAQTTGGAQQPAEASQAAPGATGQAPDGGAGIAQGIGSGAMYGGQSGGYANPMVDQLLAQTQSQQDAANAANEARFAQAMGLATDLRDRALDRLSGYGDSQRQELSDFYTQRRGETTSSLIGRGLGNTTVLDSMQRGVDKAEQKSRLQLEDSLIQMLQNADASGIDRILQLLGSKTDQGPDLSQLYQIIQNLGAGGGGQYGGGGGFVNPNPGAYPGGGQQQPQQPAGGQQTTPNPYYPGGQGNPMPAGGGAATAPGGGTPNFYAGPAYPGQQPVWGGNQGGAAAPPAGGMGGAAITGSPDPWQGARGQVMGVDYSNAQMAPWHPAAAGQAQPASQTRPDYSNVVLAGAAGGMPQETPGVGMPSTGSSNWDVNATSGTNSQGATWTGGGGYVNPNVNYGGQGQTDLALYQQRRSMMTPRPN